MSAPRVRLLGVTVTPAVVLDDGNDLIARSAGALNIPAHRLDELSALLREALADLQAQLDNEGEGPS